MRDQNLRWSLEDGEGTFNLLSSCCLLLYYLEIDGQIKFKVVYK